MDLVVVGTNHARAPLEVRERLAFAPEARVAALARIEAPEAVLLCTCNRVEIYAAGAEAGGLARFLSAERGVSLEELEPVLYRRAGDDAARHLLRVASGLDALAVGETQVLGQVRRAYREAHEAGRTGRTLNPLFHRAFCAAKRVHSETGLAGRPRSIPALAARLAEKIFRDLRRRTVLVIGAGDTGEGAVKALLHRGAARLLVVNRTVERARALVARHGGEAHPLGALRDLLPRADVVVACAESDRYLIGAAEIREALRARRNESILVIDLGVPRNVDPEIHRVENAFLYHLDDLESIVLGMRAERSRELDRAERIVEEELEAFRAGRALSDVSAVVTEIRRRAHEIAEEEVRRTLSRLDGAAEEAREEVGELARRLTNKLLHPALRALRCEAARGNGSRLSDFVRELTAPRRTEDLRPP